jgi:hypothetical protein
LCERRIERDEKNYPGRSEKVKKELRIGACNLEPDLM